ncbi:unnamed protein product [Vitrella brassicaformis CCMP3155]|uniref:Uncharacterized protein n=1 Tax=Vitrella brassicaformis (strain CCMP3155) TaxID=1169540 RepID=A0A0G4FQ74_VITBC|nr:unnamed protein product [Vitrella brassicaformis CCMP3155]|eukprot:CEM15985.1 unnamed protein product [Vitrella brassicaformis CCMP3155]
MTGAAKPLWVQFVDPNSQNPYFYNVATGEMSWTDPEAPPTANGQPTEATGEGEKPADAAAAGEPTAGHVSASGDDEQGGGKKRKKDDAADADYESKYRYDPIVLEYERIPTAAQLGRPARKQAQAEFKKYSYTQGAEDYNIWYGKYASDRFDRKEREPASTRCNPYTDSGWTKADTQPETEFPAFCYYFARGCCMLGRECRYYHRVPTREDNQHLDNTHDIFGRERHMKHRDDMGGVGTFEKDCRTLFIGDLKMDRGLPDGYAVLEESVRRNFSMWGPIVHMRVIPNKNIAFVEYEYRAAAEFAKVAMMDQWLDRKDEMITVKWAYDNPNPRAQRSDDKDLKKDFDAAVDRRLTNIQDTIGGAASQGMWQAAQMEHTVRQKQAELDEQEARRAAGLPVKKSVREMGETVTAAYPDTSANYMAPNAAALAAIHQQSVQQLSQRAGPMSKEEVEEIARQQQTLGELNRMGQVLSRIDQMSANDFSVDTSAL